LPICSPTSTYALLQRTILFGFYAEVAYEMEMNLFNTECVKCEFKKPLSVSVYDAS